MTSSVIVSGGTPSTKESEFWGGEIPWITPADLSNFEGICISKGQRSISQLGLEYSSATLIPENSILFSSRAPIGYVAIAKNRLSTNQGFKNLIISKDCINAKYVYYYLKTIKPLAEKMASGTTFLELSAQKFKQMPFPLAPIEEQNRIVERIEELFSDLDNNLELLKKSLDDGNKFWQLSLYNAFGRNNSSVDLGEISEIKGGKRLPSNKTYAKEKTPYTYIRVTNFVDFSVDVDNLQYIDKETFDKLKNYTIIGNDIYLSIAGTIGLVGGIPNNLTNAVLTENAAKISLNENYTNKYIIYYLSSPQGQEQIEDSIKATSQPKLALYKIRQIKIPVNSIKEQEKICLKLDESKMNCDELSKTINKSIVEIDIMKSKILYEVFQGKYSDQLASDTSVNVLLDKISVDKNVYINEQTKIAASSKKSEREKIDIYELIKKVYKKTPFSYSELFGILKISNEALSHEFDKLLERKLIEKHFDELEGVIKYKLS